MHVPNSISEDIVDEVAFLLDTLMLEVQILHPSGCLGSIDNQRYHHS